MIEIMAFAKQMAELGITPPTIVALGIAWKINQSFNAINMRLAIVESKIGVK